MAFKFVQKLKEIFSKKAAPPAATPAPVDPAVLKDKNVREAIIKKHRKRRRKIATRAGIVALGFLSTLHLFPGLVSKPYDEFMKDKGYPDDLSKHFHTKEIRVYNRNNPLVPFHYAINNVALEWDATLEIPRDNVKDKALDVLGVAYKAPRIYWQALCQGISDFFAHDNLDAFEMSSTRTKNPRPAFIHPPGELPPQYLVESFTGLAADFKFKNKEEDLQKALYEYVMLHEARHADQFGMLYQSANEGDADVYALRILKARGAKPELLQEMVELLTHARTLGTIVGWDFSHITAPTIHTGGQTFIEMHRQQAGFTELSLLLAEVDAVNGGSHSGMPRAQRYFYLTQTLVERGYLDNNAPMQEAAVYFMHACRYFDDLCGGKIFNGVYEIPEMAQMFINTQYLDMVFKPVKDKLDVPGDSAKTATPAPKPPAAANDTATIKSRPQRPGV